MKMTKMKIKSKFRTIENKVNLFFKWLNTPSKGFQLFLQNLTVFGGFTILILCFALALNIIP